MTIAIDDPLIAAMAIDRMLPLHESSQRLRELYPQCPRVYGVAVLADVSVRRWWPLESAVSTDRLRTMFDAAAMDMYRRSAARQLAATLVHTVIGRVVALPLNESFMGLLEIQIVHLAVAALYGGLDGRGRHERR